MLLNDDIALTFNTSVIMTGMFILTLHTFVSVQKHQVANALSLECCLFQVAIPLISQGENKCPPDKCMKSMMEAIDDIYKDKDTRVEVCAHTS